MTTISVTRKCGCESTFDSSGMPPFKRDDRIGFFERTQCPRCDPKMKAKANKEREERSAQEQQDAQEAEEKAGYEPLRGSPKQVAWATKIRIQQIQGAFEALELDEGDFNIQVGDPAGQIDTASWWIDNRETTPEDLPAALAAALGTDATTGENPF